MARPTAARIPDSSQARNTASVWRTLAMSRMAVVPPVSSSVNPRRALQ